MLKIKIYRNNSHELATDFDMGDIEFDFSNQIVTSCGNPRYSNMIFLSISELIDGLLKIYSGAKQFEFVAIDSSFIINFKASKKGIDVSHNKKSYGPVSLFNILNAIASAISDFFSDPLNNLQPDGPAYKDFNFSHKNLLMTLQTLKDFPKS
ncbi:MAG: hypothetical protein RL748_1743 [Pseudomonadota bacterium]|jgi:hypothetical protein